MQEKIQDECESVVYYVPGSELIPICPARLREMRKLRQKNHEDAVRRALVLVRSIKVA